MYREYAAALQIAAAFGNECMPCRSDLYLLGSGICTVNPGSDGPLYWVAALQEWCFMCGVLLLLLATMEGRGYSWWFLELDCLSNSLLRKLIAFNTKASQHCRVLKSCRKPMVLCTCCESVWRSPKDFLNMRQNVVLARSPKLAVKQQALGFRCCTWNVLCPQTTTLDSLVSCIREKLCYVCLSSHPL
jgi:hypothetical protein